MSKKRAECLLQLNYTGKGEISAGKAAELANLPFEDFIDELKKRKMKIFSLLGISEAKEEESMAEKYLE